MSVTSTRRVSTSYGSSVQGTYDSGRNRQSFVENIDTTNNVSVQDEAGGGNYQYYARDEEKNTFNENVDNAKSVASNHINTTTAVAPILDNVEDENTISRDKSVGIYGTNQEISQPSSERVDNPYLKHFYENNEVIDDIDEFI